MPHPQHTLIRFKRLILLIRLIRFLRLIRPPKLPHDLYGLSKVHIAQRIAERDDAVCFIIFACYGYGEKESRFPTYALLQNIRGQAITIEKNVIFDYLFVEDMQELIAQSLRKPPNASLINMTPTLSISLPLLAELVNEIGENSSEIRILNPALQNEYTGDNSVLCSQFPAFRFTEYTTGIRKLYHHLLNDYNTVQKQLS